jgi:transcriptional regulator with XRE-family HTH domain
MTQLESTGARVAASRLALGLTQHQVTEALNAAGFDMHQTTLSKVEKDQRRLWLDEASELAQILGVDLAYLAGMESGGGPDPERLRVQWEALRSDATKAWGLLRPYIET